MKESQQTMMQHSEVKVRLLKLYLERYLNILSASRYIGDINVYDLFCGEGIYENNGKGSPIVILETIKNIYYASKANGTSKDKFNCFFNDIEKWKQINTKTWDEIKNKYNMNFNTLVVVCQGALYYIIKENPDFVESFDKIIIENETIDSEIYYS
jgi:three-Cys-motif partner protein